MAFFAICSILEKVEDDCWVIEFPSCISSEARPFLYKVAAYFKLAYHTQGKSGKNRRTLMYPGSQFKDKQEAENRDKQKDADKIRDKFEKFGFTDIPLGAQGTWREGYIQALIDAKKDGRDLNFTHEFVDTYLPASPEKFLQHLKPLVETKMAELKASKFFQDAPEVEAEKEPAKTEAESPAENAPAAKPKKKKKNKKPAAAETDTKPTEVLEVPVQEEIKQPEPAVKEAPKL